MQQTLLSKIANKMSNFLTYQDNPPPTRFVLGEQYERRDPEQQPDSSLQRQQQQLASLLAYARQLEATVEKTVVALPSSSPQELQTLAGEVVLLEQEYAALSPLLLGYNTGVDDLALVPLHASLVENRQLAEKIFHLPLNQDVITRAFSLPLRTPVNALLIYMEGISDKKLIDQVVLSPLMNLSRSQQLSLDPNATDTLIASVLPSNQAKKLTSLGDVEQAVHSGNTVILIDGLHEAIAVDTKGWEHRSVDKPAIEPSIRGSQSSFTETLTVNTALIRTKLRTSDLITEALTIGDRGNTRCALMYLQSVANPKLVDEIRRRITAISTDVITDIGVLEQFIDEHPLIPFPTVLSTERPDRVPVHLAEGRVAVLLEGSPFAIIAPISLFSLFHAIDDYSFKLPAGVFMRMLRFFGAFLSALSWSLSSPSLVWLLFPCLTTACLLPSG